MAESFMNNIQSIELGQLVLDGPNPSSCIMIQTLRNKYCFRLSETFPIEKQIEIFKQFVTDIKTPVEMPKLEEVMQNEIDSKKEEKHDGANLLDVPPSAPTDCEITVPHGCATQD